MMKNDAVNELLAGADSMVSTETITDVWAEYFDSFRKLCHGMYRDEIEVLYKEITPICEQLYGTPDKATNTFEVLSELYVTYLAWKAKDKKYFDFDKGLRSAYVYVYSKLYMNTLPDLYQHGSAIESGVPLDDEQEALKCFALSLDHWGLKNFTLYETFPGTIILRGKDVWQLMSIKPCKVKNSTVTWIGRRLHINYDMFTMKFELWKD